MSWDCWIGDEDGSTESKIYLSGPYQPNPRPIPSYQILGSEHQLIGTSSASGDRVYQRFGWAGARLQVKLPRALPATYTSIDTLFRRYATGKQKEVRFSNGLHVYQCVWADYPKIEPTIRLPERYKIEFDLLILSTVS